jgi:hypothetical protein
MQAVLVWSSLKEGVRMKVDTAFGRNIALIFAVAMVMFMADLLISVHILAITSFLSGDGHFEYAQAVIRYLQAVIVVSVIGFLAGLYFCVHERLAWYAGAVCVAAMFVFQANIYFTDYTMWGFVDAALFRFPRLLLIHLLLLMAAPLGAAGGAVLGRIMHEHIGRRHKCPSPNF